MRLVRVALTMSTCNEWNMFAVLRGVSSTEFGDLETLCKAVVKEKQPFERLEISKETLLKMFKVRTGSSTRVSSRHRILCLSGRIKSGKRCCPVLKISKKLKICAALSSFPVTVS